MTSTVKPSEIDWTGRTWELTDGCTRVSPECLNCYAEYQLATRLRKHRPDVATYDPAKGARWTGEFAEHPEKLNEWRTWRRGPELVFVCSRSDLFHEKATPNFILEVWTAFCAALVKGHTFQVLTKRPERAAEILPWVYTQLAARGIWPDRGLAGLAPPTPIPLPNVWVGTSAGLAFVVRPRLAALARCPAAVRWISAEPLLEDIHRPLVGALEAHPGCFGWMIGGGETARPMTKARPTNPAWAERLRDTATAARMAFYWKQWGNWAPILGPVGRDDGPPCYIVMEDTGESGRRFPMAQMSKAEAGATLGGRLWREFPRVEGQPDWNVLFPHRYAIKKRLQQAGE